MTLEILCTAQENSLFEFQTVGSKLSGTRLPAMEMSNKFSINYEV